MFEGPVPRVFLSDTSRFGKFPSPESFARAAHDAIGKAECCPVDMTSFGARPYPPEETCRAEVQRCDIYVGVFGPFFGSPTPTDKTRSYTILEYLTALECKKPMLIFLLADNYLSPMNSQRESDDCYQLQMAFLEKVQSSTDYSYKPFASPDALGRWSIKGLWDIASN